MKKLLIVSYCILLFIVLLTPSFGAYNLLLVDDAELLDSSDSNYISEKLVEVSNKQDCDLVIVTVDSLGTKSALLFANDYFDDNGYGRGDDCSGVLLLIAMESHDFEISTSGRCETLIDEQSVADEIVSYLSNDDFCGAFKVFIDECDKQLSQEKTFQPIRFAVISIVIGVVIAFILTNVH